MKSRSEEVLCKAAMFGGSGVIVTMLGDWIRSAWAYLDNVIAIRRSGCRLWNQHELPFPIVGLAEYSVSLQT